MSNRKNRAEQPDGDAAFETASPDEILEDVAFDEESRGANATRGAEDESTGATAEDDLETQLATARTRADENWDRLVRAQAEMDNLRKRNTRDIENAHKFALEKIAGELLVVRDSLDNSILASGAEDTSVAKLREGSELILKQLIQVMEKFNIVEVDPAGEKFNPELHQAMSMQAAPDTEPNQVISVMQKGYTLNDRLIRPALVMVSK